MTDRSRIGSWTVEIRVLGPLILSRVDDPDDTLALGPSQRRLLAALCADAGRVVPSERLADILGMSSSASVRTTVHRIKRVAGDIIHHRPPGYMLERSAVDAHRFVNALAEARDADPADAVRIYTEALALWHGPAYAEFADDDWAMAEAARLDELRVTARSERIDALMATDLHTDAAAEAEQLIRDQPFRTRPRAQLMNALDLQGRQTEALRAYQDFRSFLADEAGVEPPAELVELERRILSRGQESTAPTPAITAVQTQPDGTVSFLFAGIEGSAERWESSPDVMNATIGDDDNSIRAALEEQGGWVFSHGIDGIGAAFRSASAAIRAAVSIAGRDLPVPVRLGVATGEAERRDGNYFGPIVNRAARVMAAAHPGQILVASSTAAMVDDAEFDDLGRHRLRDLPDPIGLHQVVADGLRRDFPPVISDRSAPGNLPELTHRLVGRDTEIQALTQLLETQRLVSLTGSGGVGKTSLALHVAHAAAGEFGDGVWWVELATVSEASDVTEVVAGAMGVQPTPGVRLGDAIGAALADQRTLVVLDNCEHVLDAAADIASLLLGASRDVTVIATSREHLRIPGERVWSVPALDSSDGDSPAIELFIERARAATPDFDPTDDMQSIIEICRRLDGVALAIELAAARTVSMSPSDVEARLSDRFKLLSVPRRGLEHQQTLRSTVEWSYELLEDDERDLLTRLAVFVDGFDLDASARVAAPDDWDEFHVLDTIESLVRRSLLTTDRLHGRIRYGMMETIREFALSELDAAGQVAVHEARHAEYFAELAEQNWYRWQGPEQRAAIEWSEIELANLRRAFRTSVDAGDLATAASIAAHATYIIQIRQRYEPISWAEEIIVAATEAEVPLLARLYGAVGLATMAGRQAEAAGYAARGDALELVDDHPVSRTWAAFFRAVTSRYGDHPEEYVSRCRRLADAIDEPPDDGSGLVLGSGGLLTAPDQFSSVEEVRPIGDRAVQTALRLGNPFLITFSMSGYGRAIARWDPVEALRLLREAHAQAQRGGLSFWEATIAREIAGLEAVHGTVSSALDYFATAFDSFELTENRNAAGLAFATLSATFLRMGRLHAAAVLYGCHQQAPHAYLPEGLELPDDDESTADAIAEGAAMDLREALGYARREIRLARQDNTIQRDL